jgi:hypothetical protein
MTPRANSFDAFCRKAFDFLDSSGVRHLVIGGLAVIAVGEPRTTADVDVVVYLTDREGEELLERALQAGFDLDMDVERKRLRTTGTLRLRGGAFQLDMIFASLPFEDAAFRRAVRHRLFGRLVRLPTPEDLILFKVLAGRDKDLLDAAGIVRRHAERIDWTYVESMLRELCDLAQDMRAWRRLEQVRAKVQAG